MQTENLKLLRELRTQEKALKARIDSISDAAISEAVAILAAEGKDRGEFTISSAPMFSTSPTTINKKANKPSNGARMPARRSRNKTLSKPALPSWPATSRPSSNSIPTNNPTRSN